MLLHGAIRRAGGTNIYDRCHAGTRKPGYGKNLNSDSRLPNPPVKDKRPTGVAVRDRITPDLAIMILAAAVPWEMVIILSFTGCTKSWRCISANGMFWILLIPMRLNAYDGAAAFRHAAKCG